MRSERCHEVAVSGIWGIIMAIPTGIGAWVVMAKGGLVYLGIMGVLALVAFAPFAHAEARWGLTWKADAVQGVAVGHMSFGKVLFEFLHGNVQPARCDIRRPHSASIPYRRSISA